MASLRYERPKKRPTFLNIITWYNSIFNCVAVFNFEILQKYYKKRKIYKSISLQQIPPDATICDLFFYFFLGGGPQDPRRVRWAAHIGYGGSPNGSHELWRVHSLPVSEKLRKSVPLALCVHMFITLATPLDSRMLFKHKMSCTVPACHNSLSPTFQCLYCVHPTA